jgi:HK97 family phage major capsid protein
MEDNTQVLEAIKGVGSNFEAKHAAALQMLNEQKGIMERKYDEAEAARKKADEHNEAQVKQLNEDLAKKGADLEAIKKEVLEFKAKQGRFKGASGEETKSYQSVMNEVFAEKLEEIKSVDKGRGIKLELKAAGTMTLTSNLTGNAPTTWSPDVAVRGRRKVNFRDLVPIIQSNTGTWNYYTQPSVVGEGAIDVQGSPGGTKAQLDYDLVEQSVKLRFIAGFVRFDKGMASDLAFLRTYLSSELVEDFKRVETGIFLPRIYNVATGSTTTSAGAPGTGVLAEKYIDWIANLMASDYDATAIVTTAANWGLILKTKPNDYSIPGGVGIDLQGNIRFAGIPLVPQNNMPTGKTLIGDFSKAALVQGEGMNIQFFEQDSDNVQKNLITARIEAREDIAVFRPDAFIYGSN